MPEITPIELFLENNTGSIRLGQVVIFLGEGNRFELRHQEDLTEDPNSLSEADLKELRKIADFTASGQFRPLKSAPNLRKGWKHLTSTLPALEIALNILYPGALADRHALLTNRGKPTDYRPFTARQTGMYRITTMLSDEQAAASVRACCHLRFCIKQRLWTVPNLPVDPAEEKSNIPCLEPCAVMLEFARKSMRIVQEDQLSAEVSFSDAETIFAALEKIAVQPSTSIREADFSNPGNGRRAQLVLEKLRPMLKAKTEQAKTAGE
ncbi:MAG: DR2241 family protein [Verrucomicrobiota bacterium]|nr:DR2241 family protein [Verrucomicrobiota bacterium]